MNAWTPEPWIVSGKRLDSSAIIESESDTKEEENLFVAQTGDMDDAWRIVACVNGCAGLNPAAYRECFEIIGRLALKPTSQENPREIQSKWLDDLIWEARHALAQAQPHE